MNKQNIFLSAFFVIVITVVLFAFSTAFSAFQITGPVTGQQTRMSLSPFDRGLALQLMDKDSDGKCDACGMDIQLCMDSGQIQCNMDSKSTIGVLGSQHIHADWKVYINGKALDAAFFEPLAMDMSKMDNKKTSSFTHLDRGAPSPEKTGDLIHMHATGVPLWIFFKSVGMDFNKESFTLPDGRKFPNDGKNTLKFYVNGKPNSEWENYVFSDLDNILISYGNEIDLTQQLNSITNFAKNH